MPVTQGDNGYDYPFQVKKDGIVSLANASVKVALKNPSAQVIIKDAVITNASSGKCFFALYSRDLTEAGTYSYQWTVTFYDGRIFSGSPISFYVEASNAPTPGSGGGQGSPYATLDDIKFLQEQIDLIRASGGAGGGNDMPLVTVKDAFGGTGNITKTYATNMVGFTLNNKGTTDITIAINNLTIVVEAGAVFDDLFDPFKSLTITANGAYYAEVKGYIVGANSQPTDVTPPILTITPNGSHFVTSQGVTLTTNEIADIYYTLDNSTPTILSPKYTGVINLTATTTIKAMAVDAAGNQCLVQTAIFVQDATAPTDTTPPTITASPNGGTFNVAQSVTLTANETATIYYTLDGSAPTINSPVYSSPLQIGTNKTLKFFGKDTSGNISAVQTAVFTINIPDTTPPQPVSNLAAGTVTTNTIPVSWTKSVSADVANYEVAYSSDGGNTFTVASGAVNASSTSYTVNGLNASTAYIIRLVAIDGANNRSTPVTVSATTAAPADTTPPIVTASPAAGLYNANQNIALSANETATIYYTMDGTTPTTASAVYNGPIPITATTTFKYFGKDTAGNSSAVQTATYTIDKVAPTITATPAAGTYTSAQNITLSADETANIYYTIDGSTPTTSSPVYSSPIPLSQTTTIKYLAVDAAGNQTTGSAVYTINIVYSYLQMNGAVNGAGNPSDNLSTPSLTFNQVIMDIYIPSGQGGTLYTANPTVQDTQLGVSADGTADGENYPAFDVFVNAETTKRNTYNMNFPRDTRFTLKQVGSVDFLNSGNPITAVSHIFSNQGEIQNLIGRIYDVKFYNGATLIAHYDMTKGNVLDQSGNGNNGILRGGTWV